MPRGFVTWTEAMSLFEFRKGLSDKHVCVYRELMSLLHIEIAEHERDGRLNGHRHFMVAVGNSCIEARLRLSPDTVDICIVRIVIADGPGWDPGGGGGGGLRPINWNDLLLVMEFRLVGAGRRWRLMQDFGERIGSPLPLDGRVREHVVLALSDSEKAFVLSSVKFLSSVDRGDNAGIEMFLTVNWLDVHVEARLQDLIEASEYESKMVLKIQLIKKLGVMHIRGAMTATPHALASKRAAEKIWRFSNDMLDDKSLESFVRGDTEADLDFMQFVTGLALDDDRVCSGWVNLFSGRLDDGIGNTQSDIADVLAFDRYGAGIGRDEVVSFVFHEHPTSRAPDIAELMEGADVFVLLPGHLPWPRSIEDSARHQSIRGIGLQREHWCWGEAEARTTARRKPSDQHLH